MTTYRITAAVPDMHRLISLARAEQQWTGGRLLWPVVLAEAGGEVLAGCATQAQHGLVVAAPLVLRHDLGRRAAVIAYRLGQVYDRAMLAAGVRAYYAHVAGELTQWQYVLERLGFVPVPVEGETGQWYRRETGRWGQVLDSRHAEPVDGLRQRLRAAQ